MGVLPCEVAGRSYFLLYKDCKYRSRTEGNQRGQLTGTLFSGFCTGKV